MEVGVAGLCETKSNSFHLRLELCSIVFKPNHMYPSNTKEFYPGVLGGAHWISLTDRDEEGQWSDYYTHQKLEDVDKEIFGGELNGGTRENCGLLVGPWKGWNDWGCELNKDSPIMCSCQHPAPNVDVLTYERTVPRLLCRSVFCPK
jgi:hypothetical protein